MKYLYSSATFTSKTLSAFVMALMALLAFMPNRVHAQCTPQTLPYFQTFEPAGLPACWSQDTTDDADWVSQTGPTPTANTGPDFDVFNYGSYMYVDAAANNPGDFAQLVSPEIAVGTNATATFMYHMWGVQMGTLDFEVESPAGSGNWVNIWAQQGNKGQQWQSASVSLAAFAGQTVRFQFVAELGSGNESDIAIDLFQVRTTNCPVPTFATLSNINISSVTLGFNTGGGTSFIVEYGPAGFTPGTGTSVNNSSGTVNITGLTASTSYDVYVKASCATATPNAGPYSFTTLDCDLPTNLSTTNITNNSATLNWFVSVAPVVDIWVYEASLYPGTPFLTVTTSGSSYNVTGLSQTTDYVWEIRGNCTSIAGNPSGNVGPIAFSTPCPTGNSELILIIDHTVSSYPDEVYWKLKDGSGNVIDSVIAGTYTSAGQVFTYSYCVPSNAAYTFEAYDSYGDGWNSATYTIQFECSFLNIGPVMPNDGAFGSNTIEQTENIDYDCSCPPPTALAMSNVTATTATGSWSAPATAPSNGYDYEVRSSGAPGSGATGLLSSGNTSSTSVNISGLPDSSPLTMYVRANCGGTSRSAWISAGFATDGYCQTSFSDPADSKIQEVTINGVTVTSPVGTGNCANYTDYTGLPAFPLGYGVSYPMSVMRGTCGGNYAGYVKVWIDFNNDFVFSANEVVLEGSVSNAIGATLSGFINLPPVAQHFGNTRMRVVEREGGSTTTTVACGAIGNWGEVQDFTINLTPPPACLPVTMNTSPLVGVTTANVSWTDNSGSGVFTVEYGPSPLTPGTGTILTGYTSTTLSLTGLTASTGYTVLVTADCSASGDGLSTVSSLSFTTTPPLCGTPITTFPDLQNFNSFTHTTSSSCLVTMSPQISGTWLNVTGDSYDWKVGGNNTAYSSSTGPRHGVSGVNGDKYLFTEGGCSNATHILESECFDFTGFSNPTIEFYYHRYGTMPQMGPMQLWANDGTGWVQLWEITGVTQTGELDPWISARVYMPQYAGETVKFRFIGITGTSTFQGDMALDEITVQEGPSCLDPQNLTASNITKNSVDLSWGSLGTGFSWYVEAIPADTSLPTISLSTTSMMAAITGLASNTVYSIQVREICTDTSLAAIVNIQTLCGSYTAPYFEGFDQYNYTSSSGISDCWGRIFTSPANIYATRSNSNITTSAQGYVYFNNSTSAADVVLVSPEFSDMGSGDKEVRFSLRSSSASATSTILVGTMSDPTDPSTFVLVEEITGITSTVSPYNVSLGMVPTGHKHIAFKHGAQTTSQLFYFDAINYVTASTCPAPSNLSGSASAIGELDLSWNGAGASYQVGYDTIAPAQGLIISGIMSGPTGGNPKMLELYALSDIPSLGAYGIYMNSNGSTTVPSATSIFYLPNLRVAAGTYIYLAYNSSTTTDNSNFTTFFGFPQTFFNAGMNFNGDDAVTLYLNGNVHDRYAPIGSPYLNQPWNYSNGWAYSNSGREPNGGNFDLSDWTMGSVAGETDNASAANPMPIGTFSAGSTNYQGNTAIVSGNSTTLTGLADATQYFVLVREICAPGDTSAWSSPIGITTACAAVAAPFSELFDTGVLPNCWSIFSLDGDISANANWKFGSGVGYDAQTNNGRATGTYAWVDGSTPANSTAVLESPYIDVSSLTNPVLEFQFYSYNVTSASSGYMTFKVDFFNGTQWYNNIYSFQGSNINWQDISLPVVNYNINGLVKVRFKVDQTTATSAFYNDILLDSVAIIEGPPCFTPNGLAVTNVYDVTATASWVTGNSNNWDLSLGAPGFNPDSGTVINTSSNPYNFTTLTPNTAYELYVRDNCGTDGNSAWFGPVAFSTGACPPVIVSTYPYSEDFDTTTVLQVPCGWDFTDANSDNIEWEVLKRKSLANSDQRSVRIEYNANAAMNDWLFTPGMVMGAYQSFDVKFKYRTRSEFFVEELDLTFGNAKTPAAQNEILWMGNNLTNNFYDSVEVTFRPTAAGTYFVGFHGISSANQFALYIDDFEIRETDCPSPYLVTIGTLTYTTAQVSWSGFGSSYIVEYGPTGFTPGTGTTVNVNGTSTVLTGLNVGFNYQVYVYQDCQASAKGVSLAEGPTAFATRCPDLNVTYPELCIDNGPFTLYGGTPAGGTYSGPGVSGGVFDPAVAGAGTHTITYAIAGTNACPVPTTTTIKVNPLPNPTLVPFGNVCIGVTPYTITNGNPQGGVYSGPGVVGGTVFNPVLAGLGPHTLVYTYTDANGCVRSISGPINVTPLPTTTLATQASVCGTLGGPVALTGGAPAGGTYSGPGVINNMFYPDIAGIGIHQITYTYSLGPGCTTSATRNKQVYSIPAPNAGADQTILYGTNTQLVTTTTGGSGLYSFSWSPADSLVNPNVQSPFTENLSVINTFVVQVTDLQSGCVGYDTVVVNITGGPLFLQNSGDVTICQGQSATLYALPTGGTENYQYFWTPSTYLSNPYDSLVIATPPVTTTYQILLFDGFNYRSNYVTVNVLPVPSVGLNNFNALCANASAFTLTGGQPAGGTYSGVGVSGGMFDPAVAGVGTHTITYTYTNAQGCSSSASKTITINAMPSVEMANFTNVCLDNGPIMLTNGSPFGGSYSGTGVGNGVFYPSVAGVGMHTITYSYMDANGCGGTASKTIEVYDLPTVSMTSLGSVCVDAMPVVLSSGTPTGGTYSGNGVSNGEFIPALAGVGVHTITYSYADGNGCARSATGTVTVTPIPSVNLGNFASVCVSSSSMMLSGGNPAGGTYSGPGVSAGMFNPTAAGVGTHTITYTYTDAQGCSNSASKSITVLALPTITFGSIANVCQGSAEFTLGTAFPLGGSYSGMGVSNGKFNPVTAGVGTHTITYTYTNASGCTNTATQTVTVNALPTVTFAVLSAVCEDAAAFALTGGTPTGGNYTGPGVSAGMFHPSQAGPGTHTITYTYTDVNGCSNSATRTITVNGLPVVNVAPVPNQCSNSANVTLNFGTPAGGTYSGPGVTGSTFSPAAAGLGNHILTYSVTNANGCSSSTTFTIIVNAAPTVTLGPVAPLCIDGSPIQLLTGQPGGGTYSGTGVSGGMFDPQVAGVGVHTITYSYSNAAGCSGTATQTFAVEALPTVNLNNYAAVCKDEPAFTLSGGTPAGGVYSGPGVFNGMFYPSIVSAGTYSVVYTYTSAAGCVNSDAGTITVNALPAQPYITQVSTVLTANSSVPGVSYQWLDANQNPIAGATGQTYTVTGNGVFYVEITDANGCSSTSNRFLVDFTGIEEELANGMDIQIYPNPNNGVFTLDILGAYGQEIGVTITDAVGKVVQKFDIPVDNMDKLSRTIDLSGYSKGVYLISVNTENRLINKKVVVQ